MRKVAFFDFCETLVSFQTADCFIDYVRDRRNQKGWMYFLNKIYLVFLKTRIAAIFNVFVPNKSLPKRIKLLQLRNISAVEIEFLSYDFYKEFIKPNLIRSTISEMEELKNNGYEICIVSGGYSLYLKHFVSEYLIDNLIATEIAFKENNGLCRGTIEGNDCIGPEKVRRINIDYSNFRIDFNSSIAYSDSISDLPMLLLTGKSVVVSKNTTSPWYKDYNFTEIIWTKIDQ